MSTLIEALRREHFQIADTLNEVRKCGIGSKEGQERLLSARTALLAHLRVEDEELYPALRKAAEKNESLKRTVDMFSSERESVSKEVLSFFEKYSHGGSGLEFAREFGHLYAVLMQRINSEEKFLYPEYDKLKLPA